MKTKSNFFSDKKKEIYIGLILLCVIIEAICHFVLKTEVVYTHIFYIPIILAAYWWGLRGGLLASCFLSLLHIIPNLLGLSNISNLQIIETLTRGTFFILVGFFVGRISENKLNIDKELIQSKEDLKLWGETLEKKVDEKTKDLSLLFKVNSIASSTMNLDSLIKKILNIFVKITDAKSGIISLIDSSTIHHCWEIKRCFNFECPAFEITKSRCWEIPGTPCYENYFKKAKDNQTMCIGCEVFQEAEIVPYANKGLKKEMLNEFKGKVEDSICGKIIAKEKPSILLFKSKNKNCNLDFNNENFLGVPLVTREGVIGVMCLFGVDDEKFNKEKMDLISTASMQIAVAIKNVQLYAAAETLALTDDLTGLHNYRSFQNKLLEEVERAKRGNCPLTMAIVDVDGFKIYNDNLGHMAGNKTLKKLAFLLENEVRVYDIVARYGGDEFCIIFPGTDKEEALEIADRVRASVEKHKFSMEDAVPGGITLSTGLATYPSDAKYIEDLIGCADKALYEAKNAGRNLIRVAKSLDKRAM
ncbi:diguanylate cyclase [Candidatus Oleimmundimicrobium sp.]|uniref:diguanylate cyclase n=1 Tax=Candidatus Oleimmundimicrobium sp. TaxID=3060597 RepID=UPI00271B6C83|nr:diguanylate cyclase [Candidatus Oleimmundimicrobium sp.]MDO8885485.1 diguanylate cyclase [Candidatus Oleimmundimicrobium sp.]